MEPDELRYREFRRSVRGYSPDEVDDLLDSVADELDGLYAERDRLSGELEEARRRIEQYESLEGSIRATLAQAEKAAEDYQSAARRDAEATVENARREAELMVHDAEARAHRMLADSSGKVERVEDSYEALRETRRMFDADFKRLLKGYLRLLDEANSATAREIEAPLRERLDPEAIAAARAAAEEPVSPEGDPGQDEATHIEIRYGEGETETPAAGDAEEAVSGEGSGEEDGSVRRGRFLRRRG